MKTTTHDPGHPLRGPEEAARVAARGVEGLPQDRPQARRRRRCTTYPSRRIRRGVYAGWDGDRPTKNLDATIHEIAPQTTTTIHRHSWDAIMFIESGSRLDRDRRPAHRLAALGHAPPARAGPGTATATTRDKPAVFHTWSVEPMLEQFGVALLEEGGDTPGRGPAAAAAAGAPRRRATDPYARRTQRLAQPVGGHASQRPAHHALRRRARPRHEARRAQPVPRRQVDRLPHRRPVARSCTSSRRACTSRATATAARPGCTSSPGAGYSDGRRRAARLGRRRPRSSSTTGRGTSTSTTTRSGPRGSIRVHNFDALYDMMRILARPAEPVRGAARRSTRPTSPASSGRTTSKDGRRLGDAGVTVPPGVEGIVGMHELPDPAWAEPLGRASSCPEHIKERLLNFIAVLAAPPRPRGCRRGCRSTDSSCSSGPPGTGKTTLAGGLADQAARALGDGRSCSSRSTPTRSRARCSARASGSVARLFERTLPDLAQRGRPDDRPARRGRVARGEPHRRVARDEPGRRPSRDRRGARPASIRSRAPVPNVTFVATTNYPVGVDAAFLSRADLVEEIGLPGAAAVAQILATRSRELAGRPRSTTRRCGALANACADAAARRAPGAQARPARDRDRAASWRSTRSSISRARPRRDVPTSSGERLESAV